MQPVGISNRSGSTSGDPDAIAAARDQRIATCRAMVRQTRVISRILGERLAANPEFSMLIDVYLAGLEQRETCLWEVCNATTIPMTTAHRKLGRLIEQGLIKRIPAVKDHRRIGLRITANASAKLDALMADLAEYVDAPPKL